MSPKLQILILLSGSYRFILCLVQRISWVPSLVELCKYYHFISQLDEYNQWARLRETLGTTPNPSPIRELDVTHLACGLHVLLFTPPRTLSCGQFLLYQVNGSYIFFNTNPLSADTPHTQVWRLMTSVLIASPKKTFIFMMTASE